jgi:hypothetical protein
MLLAGLATQNKIGLLVVAGIFVGFALVCSFVISRRNPDFPGEKGIGVFAIVCVVLFAAQLTSILVFDKEKKEKPAKASPAHVHAQALKLQSHAQRTSK